MPSGMPASIWNMSTYQDIQVGDEANITWYSNIFYQRKWGQLIRKEFLYSDAFSFCILYQSGRDEQPFFQPVRLLYSLSVQALQTRIWLVLRNFSSIAKRNSLRYIDKTFQDRTQRPKTYSTTNHIGHTLSSQYDIRSQHVVYSIRLVANLFNS